MSKRALRLISQFSGFVLIGFGIYFGWQAAQQLLLRW